MVYRPMLLTVFCVLCFAGSDATAQEGEVWPRLERSYLNHFYQEEDSYSNKCFDDVFIDQQGRLCLIPCGLDILINSIGLFYFDGYDFEPVALFTPEGSVMEVPWVRSMDSHGRIAASGGRGELYLINPDTRQGQLVTPSDSAFRDVKVIDLAVGDDTTFVLGKLPDDDLAFFKVQEGQLVKASPFVDPASDPGGLYDLTVGEQSIWTTTFTLPLYRFDRQRGTVHRYTAQDFVGQPMTATEEKTSNATLLPKVVEAPNGQTYVFFSFKYGQKLFRLDRETDQFLTMAEQFPADWQPAGLFQDEAGNSCFLFQDATDAYRAVLETIDGQRFNYTDLVAGQSNIKRLAGQDFRRQVFILTDRGLSSAGIREQNAIRQAMSGKWISAMAELPDGRLLVNTVLEGWFTYDEATGRVLPFQGPDCDTKRPVFGKGMKQQIIPDKEGNLWFISNNNLVRYTPSTNDCQVFPFEHNLALFARAQGDMVVLQYSRQHLSFFNISTQQSVSFGPGIQTSFDGFIRDIHVDANGIVWIPTNDGLAKVDLDEGTSEILGLDDGFADFRFTSIFEDQQGRLWLGTYFGGLHIFDPLTGAVTVIDQGRGLSNNTVMSIIADDQGDMWVGTEYGINLVSQAGEVLNNFHREDGLTYDIFERFDPYRGKDGRLYFGSREGISIIDPEALKAYVKRDADVEIYPTELSYFDQEKGEDVVQKSHFDQIERLSIPPERPYLRMKFGLSSYLEPQNNRYAYRLEGKDDDWTYLGTQPELNISRLPPGKYRLLVKGADFRNNWTAEPLVVEIHAREFFYKQPWFYVLAALPFLAFGLIWARNKQLEARRLELEVARRTQEIREDKAVIEQQAAELRQLDTMKSRFFTNISHELRTPITLIKAPLENLMQKHGSSLNEQLQRSLGLILKNTGKLGSLVEELLELSSLEAKKATLKETPTPLAIFCRQLFGAYESGAGLKDIDYQFTAKLAEDAWFLIDRKRLEKVVNNLLSNALKFTPRGGHVHMILRRESDHLLLEVKDSGRGIPPEDIPHLFDRYFQTRRTDVATDGGTGIGLALSRELAHLMEGDLTVASEWGAGASFTLRFPAREALPEGEAPELPTQIVEEEPESETVAAPVTAGADAAVAKVLIVEDNRDMQQLIYHLLADQYDCIVANNGAEAWAWLQEENEDIGAIELILSDVMMPEMDGYTLLEHIKAHPRWQKLPVVMLTARSAEADKLQALRMGVDDYLLKPFSPEELRARLHNLITNYRVRKEVAARVEEPAASVDITFAPEESAQSVWLQEVEEAAREALDKGIKLTTAFLADRVFLSERQFSRKLKSATGLTPNGYIQEVKLQKARHLLEHQVYTTVNEVAQATGYSSGSYLTRVYQPRFGKKPGDYF